MLYDIAALIIVLVGCILAWLAARLLVRKGWLLGWLQGTFGLIMIATAVGVVLVAWDIYRYEEILDEKSIATISFEKRQDQYFQATVVTSEGSESVYGLRGDQWQLDARIFKWSPSMVALGLKSGYRLDRLSGRYYSLEKERNAERTTYQLNPSLLQVDVWQWCNRFGQQLPWLKAIHGSATFIPMSDGALYEVQLNASGLVARPLNERAQTAVSRWQ